MNAAKFTTCLLLFLVSVVLVGGQGKTLKDDLGFDFTIGTPPQRIVSLAPNITEILFALGLGERVVGVTRYCDYPRQALEKEKIGGLVDPRLEKIVALNPDLIIGFRGNPLRILERIRRLRLPLFVLEMGADLESVFRLILTVGTITRSEKSAEALLLSLRSKYGAIQSALGCAEHEPKVFISLHGTGFWTCGNGSFLHDLLAKARGANVAGAVSRKWLHINREQLINEDPEVIIILARSWDDFLKSRNWITNLAYLGGIRAVRSESIYFLDQNQATRPGPRLIEALESLARLLHPECFKED